jgi:hypothetical protein
MSSKIQEFIKTKFSSKIKDTVPTFSPRSKAFMQTLYDSILESNQLWNKVSKGSIKGSVITTSSSNYVPDHIPYPAIKTMTFTKQTYSFVVRSRKINVEMAYPTGTLSNAQISKFFQGAIHKIYMWIYVATKFASASCSNTMSIRLYFTEYAKTLSRTKTEPLNTVHVNTAFTTSCSPSTDIFLFRREEWFKVFIHETFHNLGLDFSSMDNIEANVMVSKIFPVTGDIRLFETYCEMWAEIINALFISFFSTTKANDHKSTVINKIRLILGSESIFSAFQCAKILEHYGLTYHDMTSSQRRSIGLKQYNEKTYVLSYYVIKSILMTHVNDFIEWCLDHNGSTLDFKKTQTNISDFVTLIIQLYKTPKHLELIDFAEKVDLSDVDDFIRHTLRMTVFG